MPTADHDRRCYRCQGPTTPGMLIDHDLATPNQVRWASGGPRGGVGGALSGEGTGERLRYRVVTYRCQQCGALESFAHDPG